ncbi:MAG: selenocysteine-specific translation elongation factor [Candidatus Eisenbacteria bacterium]
MKNVVIGTAGHIDHGKTALVKLLTGIDTDRLKEEKERGISIDLGFAHLTLPSGIRAGIVDVPGHERFVRNMLAGAGGIDIVLFIVAADEGVMPQTREHLDIVDILRVHGGVAALTKIDLVDSAWLEMVTADVRSAFEGTVLGDAPIVPVSSSTGAGKEEILEAIDDAAQRVGARPRGLFVRLPVDRVFTIEGFGTVITGTLWTGSVKVGDNLEILPSGKRVRVRNVQIFGHDVAEASPGQRVALALHGVSREELTRGDWLATPEALRTTSIIDVRFELLEDAKKALKNRSRVRLHLGASEAIGRVFLLDREELAPGHSAFAQMRFEAPIVAVEGDRFVARSYSPQFTVGGGTVLVPYSAKHKRKDTAVIDTLSLVEKGSPVERVEHAVRAAGEKGIAASEGPPPGHGTSGVSRAAGADLSAAAGVELARIAGVEPSQADEAVKELLASGVVHQVGATLFHREHISVLKKACADCLREYQEHFKLRWGMGKGELRNRFSRVPAVLFSTVMDSLVAEGVLFSREDKYRFGSPEVTLASEEAALKAELERRLLETGFNVPTLKELAGTRPPERVSDILQILVEEGKVVKVTSELFFHSAKLAEAEQGLKGFLRSKGGLQVADFKDMLKTTRKYAVPLLEYFDKKGVTKRQGDLRVPGKAT